MSNALLANGSLSLLEKAAIFGERRHEVLAGNIANISTPTYRMRDLPLREFQAAMKKAVAQLKTPTPTFATQPTSSPTPNPPTLDELFPQELFQATSAAEGSLTFQDANNRSIELETMKLTKNSMMQNFLLEVLRFQMMSLNTVISERVA